MCSRNQKKLSHSPQRPAGFLAEQEGALPWLEEATAPAPVVTLSPGKLLVTNRPVIVSTILGSCVAICLHNERLQAAAICHSILPKQAKPSVPGNFPYVDTAVAHMLDSLRQRFGLSPRDLTTKLFGGACVLAPIYEGLDDMAIGQRNIMAARESLRQLGLRLAVEKTGGTTGYKIFFNTATGEVFLRALKPGATKNIPAAMKYPHIQ